MIYRHRKVIIPPLAKSCQNFSWQVFFLSVNQLGLALWRWIMKFRNQKKFSRITVKSYSRTLLCLTRKIIFFYISKSCRRQSTLNSGLSGASQGYGIFFTPFLEKYAKIRDPSFFRALFLKSLKIFLNWAVTLFNFAWIQRRIFETGDKLDHGCHYLSHVPLQKSTFNSDLFIIWHYFRYVLFSIL